MEEKINNEKKQFVPPEIHIIKLEVADIITTSNPWETDERDTNS